jgi:hypothetical protein
MENGGGWVGFHVAAYNDKNTNWPWFVDFLGGGVFYCNNWPPQPVLVKLTMRITPSPRIYLPPLWLRPANGISGIPVREPTKT